MKVYGMEGTIPYKKDHVSMNDGLDILICTPDRLNFHLHDSNFKFNLIIEHLHMEDTKYVVIDEADTLYLNPGYNDSIESIVKQLIIVPICIFLIERPEKRIFCSIMI